MPAAVDNMAYVGAVPWHGLGNNVDADLPIDDWQVAAGLNWTADAGRMFYQTQDGETYYHEDKMQLYRSDNHVPLGIVSDKYKVVQPKEVLEFFRDLTELGGGFRMETAGSLFSGQRIWGLARHTGEQALPGGDVIKPYLLLATSMDGTLATHASFTTVRVVCNNTLQMAVHNKAEDRVRVTHNAQFNEAKVKAQLGLIDNRYTAFMELAERLSKQKVSPSIAQPFYAEVFNDAYRELEPKDKEAAHELPIVQAATEAFLTAPGQDTLSAQNTAWGLINGLTYYLDHARSTRTDDSRLQYAWFGKGKELKYRAVELAQQML